MTLPFIKREIHSSPGSMKSSEPRMWKEKELIIEISLVPCFRVSKPVSYTIHISQGPFILSSEAKNTCSVLQSPTPWAPLFLAVRSSSGVSAFAITLRCLIWSRFHSQVTHSMHPQKLQRKPERRGYHCASKPQMDNASKKKTWDSVVSKLHVGY